MKITIEVPELWIEEGELNAELKNQILHEASQKIRQEIKGKVESSIENVLRKRFDSQLEVIIGEMMQQMIDSGNLIKDRQEISISDYLKNVFNNHHGWNNPAEQVAKLAKEHGNKLKQQYDLVYASQIVAALNENGLLKDDAAKLLLKNT